MMSPQPYRTQPTRSNRTPQKLALAVGLFVLDIVALKMNVVAGAVATAVSNLIFSAFLLPTTKSAAQQIVGRPLSSFQAGQRPSKLRRLLSRRPAAPPIK